MDQEGRMNIASRRSGLSLALLTAATLALLTSGTLHAQVPVDESGNPIGSFEEAGQSPGASFVATDEELPVLAPQELEELVGPIALYPDKLLAIVLPASTYPLQIVQAARFLKQLEDDSSLEPDESWDDSVVALLNYPEVVAMMDEDIDWTWRLGEAVVGQQADVIAAIEKFRDRAYAAGNLKTDGRQTVTSNDGVIEIEPVAEDIIYVPYYEPERVVRYQPRQVYYYYPSPYPVYYFPYPQHHAFVSGYFWGVTTAFRIGWATDHLHVFHHSYWGHPYYGRHYFGHYYRRPSINIYNIYYVNNHRRYSQYNHRDGDYWRPRYDGGARPAHFRAARNEYFRDRRSERTTEGYRQPGRSGGARRVAAERERSGFLGPGANNNARQENVVNESRARFAASPNSANPGSRGRTNPAERVRQRENVASDNDTIRFRLRNGVSDDAAVARSSSNRTVVRNSANTERAVAPPAVKAPANSRPSTQAKRPAARADSTGGVAIRQRAASHRSTTVRATPSTSSSTPRATSPARSTPRATSPARSTPRATAPATSTPRATAPARSTPRAAPSSRGSAPQRTQSPPAPASATRSAPRSSQGAATGPRSKRH
jgi:hypothetical protein